MPVNANLFYTKDNSRCFTNEMNPPEKRFHAWIPIITSPCTAFLTHLNDGVVLVYSDIPSGRYI